MSHIPDAPAPKILPPRCAGCGEPLTDIEMDQETSAEYEWDGKKYIRYEGSECTMRCHICGQDLNEQFKFNNPEDFRWAKYEDPFLDKHGVKRCCRWCNHFDPNESGEYDEYMEKGDEGVCLKEGVHPVVNIDEAQSPDWCDTFKLHEKLEAVLDEITIDPWTGDLDIPPDIEWLEGMPHNQEHRPIAHEG